MSLDISIPQENCLKIKIISLSFFNKQYPITTQLLFKLNSSKSKEINLLTRNTEILIDETLEFLNIKPHTKLFLQIVLNEKFLDDSTVSNLETIEINNQLSKIQNDKDELIIFKNNCELKIKCLLIFPNNTSFSNDTHIRCFTEETMRNDNNNYLINPSFISICNSHETNTSSSSSVDNHQQFLDYEIERLSTEFEERKSICECIYIAGIPLKNSRMLPDSEKYLSSCKHKRCSLFPAYAPDILFSYSKTINTKFGIVNSIASLSFPYGIKCCFNQKEHQIPSIPNFFTVTTNENGKRHFIYMSFFYQKLDYVEFKSKYDFDPIHDQLLKNRIITLINSHSNSNANPNASQNKGKIEKEIESTLALCEELINNDYIYLPACLCIVSKLPYESQMNSCLASLIKMISISSPPKEIELFLIHLLYEIPRPSSNTELSFFTPFNSSAISINGKYIKDFPIQLSSMTILFAYFKISLIVKIFTLLLNEQKIVFISNDYNKLAEISNCFVSLLYPLTWNFTYIPILSTGMIKYIQSFIPFIMGMDEVMLAMSKEFLDNDSVIYIVFIKEKQKSEVVKSSNSKLNDESILDIPNDLKEPLVDNLNIIKSNNEKQDKRGRRLFVKLFANIIGDYNKYVSFIENCAFFNSDSFLQEKRKSDLNFYQFLINTGIFRQFIQEKKSYPYFDKIVARINQNKSKIRTIQIDKKKTSSKTIINSSRELSKLIFLRDLKGNNCKKNSSSNLNNSKASASKKNSSANVKQFNSSKKVISSIVKSSSISSPESDTKNETSINQCNHYIIPPYFIQFIHLGILDLNKIQTFLKQKYKGNDSFSLIQTKFISNISISKSSDITFNHYLLPNQRHLRLSWKRKQFTRGSNINDENVIKIQESMKSILSCEQTMIGFDLSLLPLKSNSKTFVEILYQDKFKEQNLHILNRKSFEKLSQIIFSSMLLSSFDYKQIKLITQSLFYYCKLCPNDYHYYMFEEFAKKKPFDPWTNVDFWENWFFMEGIENSLVTFNNNTNKKSTQTNEDYFMKILEISTVMNDLNINLKFQLLCLIEKIGKKYIIGTDSEEHLRILEKTILQQYKNKQMELE